MFHSRVPEPVFDMLNFLIVLFMVLLAKVLKAIPIPTPLCVSTIVLSMIAANLPKA